MHTEGTDPPRGPVPNPSTAQSGLKHHTVISVRGTSHGCQRRAGQQKRYTPAPTAPELIPETSRHGRARAEHGAGATLEVAR